MSICCLIKPAIRQALIYQLLVLLARGSRTLLLMCITAKPGPVLSSW